MSTEEHLSRQFGEYMLHYRRLRPGDFYKEIGGTHYRAGHPMQMVHVTDPTNTMRAGGSPMPSDTPIATMRFKDKAQRGTGRARIPGEILGVEVMEHHRRKGIASAMFNFAREIGAPKPRHSDDRTQAGDAWAKKVGGPVPRTKPSPWG